MELEYPFIMYIGVPFIIFILIWKLRKTDTYKKGTKVANTKYIKSLSYYKEIIKKYRLWSYLITGAYILSIFLALLLLARPVTTETKETSLYNRDIFLCMDVSTSVNELNEELVESLKDIVNNLKGERFGISIFNTSSTLLVPLTDDYDYVLDILDTLGESFQLNNRADYSFSMDNSYYILNYIEEGTLLGLETRGSSLIGDGLASCIYSFSNLEEDRTRIIIFSTDNELEGNPLVTTQEAAEIAKSKDIIVYGIAPKEIGKSDRKHVNAEAELKRAMEGTGGKLYIEASGGTVSSIVDNIEQQQQSLMQGKKETRRIDKPQIPFIILVVLVLILFILNRKVNL